MSLNWQICLGKRKKVIIMRIFKQITLGIFLIFSTLLAQAESQTEIEPFSQAELEQILAPIALYPDTVLSHILIAATYPLEIIQAERWTVKNPDYDGSDAVQAVESKDWDPSVKALVAFPEVLKRLSENLEWTQKLGDAFLQDEEKLLASVQSLRQRAYEAGSLDKMDKVSVIHDDTSIVIEPREREVVYVPYYDTRVVYGPWYWSHYPPVYWNYPHHVGYYPGRHHSPFYWGHRVHVSFGFFFSSFHWHNHHVVRIPYHHYRPHHYYDRHQIVRHQHARRWAHNPSHRRGVSYRSVTVSNRYSSNRPSRTEVRSYREETRGSSSSNQRRLTSSERRTKESKKDRTRTRIATPNRIRQELKDGKISIKERNARPTNRSQSETRTKAPTKRDSGVSTRSKERKEQTVRHPAPPKKENRRQPDVRKSESSSSSSSSSRSSERSSSKSRPSRSSSSSRSSGSRSDRSSRSESKRSRKG